MVKKALKAAMASRNRHHRRQRTLRHGRTDRPRRETIVDAIRRSVGAVCARHAAREAGGVSGAARRRPPHSAVGAELPREHLRLQGARRRADLSRRARSAASKEEYKPLDIVVPDQFFDRTQRAHQHVLRPRAGRARRVRASVLRPICSAIAADAAAGSRRRPSTAAART